MKGWLTTRKGKRLVSSGSFEFFEFKAGADALSKQDTERKAS